MTCHEMTGCTHVTSNASIVIMPIANSKTILRLDFMKRRQITERKCCSISCNCASEIGDSMDMAASGSKLTSVRFPWEHAHNTSVKPRITVGRPDRTPSVLVDRPRRNIDRQADV